MLISAIIGLLLFSFGVYGLKRRAFSFPTRQITSRNRIPVEGRLASILGGLYILGGLIILLTTGVSVFNDDVSNSLVTVTILTLMGMGFATGLFMLLQVVHHAAQDLHAFRNQDRS